MNLKFSANRKAAVAVLVFLCLTCATPLLAQQPTTSQEQQITATVTAFFAALHEESEAKLDAVVMPSFYIFENGKRYDAHSVMSLIKGVHSSGKQVEWSITSPDVRIFGNSAWIGYVNKGSFVTGQTTTPQDWLESALLEKSSGSWRVAFMQSSRVPPAADLPKQ